jgi:hypothetical protein
VVCLLPLLLWRRGTGRGGRALQYHPFLITPGRTDQPEGLAEGSRWSFRGEGKRPPVQSRRGLHPGGDARIRELQPGCLARSMNSGKLNARKFCPLPEPARFSSILGLGRPAQRACCSITFAQVPRTHSSLASWLSGRRFSLSPGERAGVRASFFQLNRSG